MEYCDSLYCAVDEKKIELQDVFLEMSVLSGK